MLELGHGCLEIMHLFPGILLNGGYAFIEDVDLVIELSLLSNVLVLLEAGTDQLLLHL